MSQDYNPRIAERLARAARAAQTLSETLWEALHEELVDPRVQPVADLTERLVDVSATVALLARSGVTASSTPQSPVAPVPRAPATADAIHEEPAPTDATQEVTRKESSFPRESPPAQRPSAAQEPQSAAVLVDELADEGLPPAPEPPVREPPDVREPPEIEIRDERHEEPRRERVHGEEGPNAWIASIGRRLERYERDREPFAVMLVELADVERLRHAELPGEVSRLTGLLEAVLANELRPADSLTRESPGRYWLLTPETDFPSARALAERLADAVRHAASHRGAPLQVAVGIAVCPVDGDRAPALAAHADIALYTARAAGQPVTPVDDSAQRLGGSPDSSS